MLHTHVPCPQAPLPAHRQTKRAGAPQHKLTYHQGRAYGADRIGLVGYHDEAFVIARPVDVFASWLSERVDRLPQLVRGCTNIAAGVRLANSMLARSPRGVLRRMWLLTDGYDTHGGWGAIQSTVAESRSLRINICAIGFGESYDRRLLEQIAAGTHNGQFVDVRDLRTLTDVLTAGGRQVRRTERLHRAETAILVIDLSGSMSGAMGASTKIGVVQEAVRRLVVYKQRLFS